MYNKNLDKCFNILNRFNTLNELGFKRCTRISNDTVEDVYAIGAPSKGLRPLDIIKMSEKEFNCLVNCYLQ